MARSFLISSTSASSAAANSGIEFGMEGDLQFDSAVRRGDGTGAKVQSEGADVLVRMAGVHRIAPTIAPDPRTSVQDPRTCAPSCPGPRFSM